MDFLGANQYPNSDVLRDMMQNKGFFVALIKSSPVA
jgi:hypothetical protein